MADLDRFKQVNDIHGHDAGDTVISVMANIINDTVRNTDFVSRYGGEEFFIILPETNEDGVLQFTEHIRTLLAGRTPPLPSAVTASFGITSANATDDLDSLLRRADQALYQAKESGRNRCHVFQETAMGG